MNGTKKNGYKGFTNVKTIKRVLTLFESKLSMTAQEIFRLPAIEFIEAEICDLYWQYEQHCYYNKAEKEAIIPRWGDIWRLDLSWRQTGIGK